MEKKPWEGEFEPLAIFGNLYFVGTVPASVHIVDTGDGLIMLDAGYVQALPTVLEHMQRVGLDPKEIRYLLLTHGHIDHMGAAKAVKALSGAKIALGLADREYANGALDLSYAKELGMEFGETFEPDILLTDGDEIALGNTRVRAVATPGHTPGAMSYFFDVTDGAEVYRAGLHGGMGINTLSRQFLEKYGLPFTLREDFVRSMHRLAQERVEIFLGNHMHHNQTAQKASRVRAGDKRAFVDPDEWSRYALWCIGNLERMIQNEQATADGNGRNTI